MVLKQKRTKVSRHRGTNSHGWGHKKKHRGSGHRGGFGLAGTGARGDSQKPGLLAKSKKLLQKMAAGKGIKLKNLVTGKDYFGKKGFTSVGKKKINVISISQIESSYDTMVSKGMIVKDVFDSTAFGYGKVLGRGKLSKKLTIICNEISDSAKATVEASGGKVEVKFPKEDEFEENSN